MLDDNGVDFRSGLFVDPDNRIDYHIVADAGYQTNNEFEYLAQDSQDCIAEASGIHVEARCVDVVGDIASAVVDHNGDKHDAKPTESQAESDVHGDMGVELVEVQPV